MDMPQRACSYLIYIYARVSGAILYTLTDLKKKGKPLWKSRKTSTSHAKQRRKNL